MVSRRIVLKNGAFALLSLGFAPSFLSRTVAAAGSASRSRRLIAIFQRGAVDGLSMIVPYGEAEYYRARLSHRASAAGSQATPCARPGRLLRPQPAPRAAEANLGPPGPRHRPRVRLARRDAVAFRRTGLHGDRHAWRQEHARRLAESLPAGARRPSRHSPFRAVALTPQTAAHAAGPGAGDRHEPDRTVRPVAAHDRCTRRSRREYAAAADRVLNGTGREAFEAMKTLKSADPARYQPENGADYPRHGVRPGAEADRPAHQGRRRTRGGVCRHRRLGHARESGLGAGTARDAARRPLPFDRGARRPTSATAWPTRSS